MYAQKFLFHFYGLKICIFMVTIEKENICVYFIWQKHLNMHAAIQRIYVMYPKKTLCMCNNT